MRIEEKLIGFSNRDLFGDLGKSSKLVGTEAKLRGLEKCGVGEKMKVNEDRQTFLGV